MDAQQLIDLTNRCNEALRVEWQLFGWLEEAPKLTAGIVRALLPVLQAPMSPEPPTGATPAAPPATPEPSPPPAIEAKRPATINTFAALSTRPEPPKKEPGRGKGKRRPLSPEHIAKIKEGQRRRREADKAKANSTPGAPPAAPTVKRLPTSNPESVREAMIAMAEHGYLCSPERWDADRPQGMPTFGEIMAALGVTSPIAIARWCGLRYAAPLVRNGQE